MFCFIFLQLNTVYYPKSPQECGRTETEAGACKVQADINLLVEKYKCQKEL
jgi:hypothetical protein